MGHGTYRRVGPMTARSKSHSSKRTINSKSALTTTPPQQAPRQEGDCTVQALVDKDGAAVKTSVIKSTGRRCPRPRLHTGHQAAALHCGPPRRGSDRRRCPDRHVLAFESLGSQRATARFRWRRGPSQSEADFYECSVLGRARSSALQ